MNAKGRNGRTHLHLAAVGLPEAIAILLNAGADSKALDDNFKLPVDYIEDSDLVKNQGLYQMLNHARSK
ncbi:MAG: hypothetical protein GDA36_11765 [Rhodobacteraceae bacterium]|nr:hypothetical protein [Paracoccaceae bacterium]